MDEQTWNDLHACVGQNSPLKGKVNENSLSLPPLSL